MQEKCPPLRAKQISCKNRLLKVLNVALLGYLWGNAYLTCTTSLKYDNLLRWKMQLVLIFQPSFPSFTRILSVTENFQVKYFGRRTIFLLRQPNTSYPHQIISQISRWKRQCLHQINITTNFREDSLFRL